MIPRLYGRDETAFTTMGICPLSDAISCKVTEEKNGQYTLSMIYPTTGMWFNEIKVDMIILAQAHENDTHTQPFRIESIQGDIDATITIRAVHISYQLNWIVAGRQTIASGTAQNNMRAVRLLQVGCPFNFYSDKTETASISTDIPVPFRSLLGGVDGSFLDAYGGEFEWDRWDVHLWESRGQDNGVRITYGKNLLGIDWETDVSETYTSVYAYWMREEEGVVTYVGSAIKTIGGDFAFDRLIAVDTSSDFQSEPSLIQLDTYAANYVKANAKTPTVSVKVKFVPLWQTEEYKEFADFERVNLCDIVHIVYPPLNIELEAQVVKTIYNVLLDRYDEIEVSTTKKNLASTIFKMQEQIKKNSLSGSSRMVIQGGS